MQTEKQQVYHCRGIVRQLNTYIKTDKLLILYESDISAEIKKDVAAQSPEAACYTVPDTAHTKAFDNLEAVVRFLYQNGRQKESSLLIIGNQQLKELGGFIASAYCCDIAYLYVPLTGSTALYATSRFCGVDLMGIPDVLQSCREPCIVFLDEDIFGSEHNAAQGYLATACRRLFFVSLEIKIQNYVYAEICRKKL